MPIYPFQGSVSVSAGANEWRRRVPVGKPAGGHGADVCDTSVLDGYLEDIKALTQGLTVALERRRGSELALRWHLAMEHIDAFVRAVDCVNDCGRTGVHDTGLDGLVCHVCFTRVLAYGPDVDAEYDAAVGK